MESTTQWQKDDEKMTVKKRLLEVGRDKTEKNIQQRKEVNKICRTLCKEWLEMERGHQNDVEETMVRNALLWNDIEQKSVTKN